MAWYYGEFRCGHEGRVNIIGPVKNRQYIADGKFDNLCEECAKEAFLRKVEKENAAAVEKSKEMELPALSGSEKQVIWANTLRQKWIDYIDNKIIYLDSENKNFRVFENEMSGFSNMKQISSVELVDFIINNYISAKWYIDNRSLQTIVVLGMFYKLYIQSKLENEIEKEIENEINEELTIHPENEISHNVVEIEAIDNNNCIRVLFEYDKNAVDLVKMLDGYKWSGSSWRKELEPLNNDILDRAAEVGNHFLKNGYPIKIDNIIAKDMAINANFKLEFKRWIKFNTKENSFMLSNYEKSRKLPTQKYVNGKTHINLSAWKEVKDFADMFGYKFSPMAIEAIEKYKDSFKVEKILSSKNRDKELNKLEEILNSNVDILDDLKDSN
jgi:hypothetical protein